MAELSDTDANVLLWDHVLLFQAWAGPVWGLIPETNGFLALSTDDHVAFTNQYTGELEFLQPLSEVTDVQWAPPFPTMLGVSKAAIRATIGGKRRVLLFDGQTHFLSTFQVIRMAITPGPDMGVFVKKGWQNRGSRKRAIQARERWMALLSGQLNAAAIEKALSEE